VDFDKDEEQGKAADFDHGHHEAGLPQAQNRQ
jgi:hypothetical protein